MATDERLNRPSAPTTKPRGTTTLAPIPFPDVGAGMGVSGSRATGTDMRGSAGTTAATSATMPRRRTLSPSATNTDNSATARVRRALAIREGAGGVQGSRATAEQGANGQLAESLRMSLIEQERLRKNAQIPGRMNAVEFRAMQAQRAGNQAAVDSGTDAINAIREGQVNRAGQLTEAETEIQDRAMAEQGAFDRGLINLDVAETQGRFGLAEQGVRNRGAVDAATALDAREQYGLSLLQRAEEDVTKRGNPIEETQFLTGGVNATFGLGGLADPTAAGPTGTVTLKGPKGLPMEVELPGADAKRINLATAVAQNPDAYGLSSDMTSEDVADFVSNKATAEEIRQRQAQRKAQRKAEREAFMSTLGPQPEAAFTEASFSWAGDAR